VLPARAVELPRDGRGTVVDPDDPAGGSRRRPVRRARLVAPSDREAPQARRPEPGCRRARRGTVARAPRREGRGSSRADPGGGAMTAPTTTTQPAPGNWFARGGDRTHGG